MGIVGLMFGIIFVWYGLKKLSDWLGDLDDY